MRRTIRLGPPRIIVDERERQSGVADRLRELGARIEHRMLDVGDYVLFECAIERKTVGDFISSLFSGRLFDQAYRLSQAYKLHFMVVEGDIGLTLAEIKNPKPFWGALVSLSMGYGMQIFFTEDQLQTADLIHALARQYPFNKRTRPPLIARKPRIERVQDAQLAVIESLPRIGPKLADRLLSRFGTVRKIFSASSSELAIKGGLGRARAQRMKAFLDAPYLQEKKEPSQARLGER